MAPAESASVARRPADAAPVVERPWVLVWRRFRRRRIALASLLLLVVVAVAVVGADLWAPYPQGQTDPAAILADPSRSHLLGTDTLGRDTFSQALYAGRVSLAVGLSVAVLATTIGTLIGMIAGYLGGWIDSVLMRFTDTMLALPSLMVVIMLSRLLGDGVFDVVLVLSVLTWMPLARIIRAKTLSLREQEFISSARAMGAGTPRVLFRHLLPNLVGEVSVAVSLAVAAAILLESVLSFLGLGVSAAHTPTWGNMLGGNEGFMLFAPWLVIAPGLAISVTVLAVNYVGDGLRDAFDVRSDAGNRGP